MFIVENTIVVTGGAGLIRCALFRYVKLGSVLAPSSKNKFSAVKLISVRFFGQLSSQGVGHLLCSN